MAESNPHAPALAEFLLTRISEDQAVIGPPPHRRDWTPIYPDSRNRLDSTHDGLMVEPSRAWAECMAKREIINETLSYEAKIDGEWGCCHTAAQIAAGKCPETPVGEIPILRLLALAYSDHPDYRDAWRPAK